MNSHNRRNNNLSKLPSKTPHFFKVILHETIRDGKLGIPRNFVRKHGNRLPSTIQLEVPSGANWQVQLTKCDENGTVFLHKGWQEFAEHFSLERGHFLVFRYEGNGHFHVLIFDKSASEIEYPCTNTEDDDDDEKSVGHFEDVSVSKKSKQNPNLPCPSPRPQKKRKTNSPNQHRRIKLGNLKKVGKSRFSTEQLDAPRSVKTEVLCCMQKLTAAEKAHYHQIASAFKCTGNPAFMVVMRPYYVSSKYALWISSNIARKFFTTPNGNLTLCDSTGKTWPAKFQLRTENVSYIYGGWREFAEDNNLSVGDFCVFELIKHPEVVLKVTIYPVVGNARKACKPLVLSPVKNEVGGNIAAPKSVKTEVLSRAQRLTAAEKARAVQRAGAFKCTGNPGFKMVMQPSFVGDKYRMGIPIDFARKYLTLRNGNLTLCNSSTGKTWPARYYMTKTVSYMYGGWRAFAEDNNLVVGDVCVFELIKHPEILFKVAIYPVVENASKAGIQLGE